MPTSYESSFTSFFQCTCAAARGAASRAAALAAGSQANPESGEVAQHTLFAPGSHEGLRSSHKPHTTPFLCVPGCVPLAVPMSSLSRALASIFTCRRRCVVAAATVGHRSECPRGIQCASLSLCNTVLLAACLPLLATSSPRRVAELDILRTNLCCSCDRCVQPECSLCGVRSV